MPTAELERMCTDLSISAARAVPGGASQVTIERELARVSSCSHPARLPAATGPRPGLRTMRVQRVLSGLSSVGLPRRTQGAANFAAMHSPETALCMPRYRVRRRAVTSQAAARTQTPSGRW